MNPALTAADLPPAAPSPGHALSPARNADVADVTPNNVIPLLSDTGHPARVGLWALGLGLGGFLLWATLAPLDEGVPSSGLVSVDTKRKAVQHLSGGIVKAVLVREGQVVKLGQPLVKLDESVARANYEFVRQRYLGLRAAQARLEAEQAGRTSLTLHPDLKEAQSDPLIRQQLSNQQMLLQSRRASLYADVQAIEESIQGQRGLIQSYTSMSGSRGNQLALLQDELGNTRSLVQDGYAPRNRQLELERMVADNSSASAELTGSTTRAQRSISELRQRAIARQQEYRKEVNTQLAEVSRDVLSEAEKYASVKADLERLEIPSPADGQVVGLNVQTVGGVIQAGQKIMDVVPENEPLLLEARVAPHLIDRVHSGLAADIRFTAFAHTPQLVVAGQVASISADLLSDPQKPEIAYYLARVSVTPEGLKTLGARQLQPGMPVEIIIKTGERSMLSYLLHPLTKRMAASMKEE